MTVRFSVEKEHFGNVARLFDDVDEETGQTEVVSLDLAESDDLLVDRIVDGFYLFFRNSFIVNRESAGRLLAEIRRHEKVTTNFESQSAVHRLIK